MRLTADLGHKHLVAGGRTSECSGPTRWRLFADNYVLTALPVDLHANAVSYGIVTLKKIGL